MKNVPKLFYTVLIFSVSCVLFSFNENKKGATVLVFPYKEAGLTERQAATHLLSRFTYGAKPGDVDAVINQGLEKWFSEQLKGGLPDEDLTERLKGYDALNLSNQEVVSTYPKAAQILRMAIKDGIIKRDSVDKSDKAAYKSLLTSYMQQKGLKPQKELFRQFINQKILRASYTNNQLQEVLTDFWFNHFNVSITKNNCAEYIPAYERDVIRPNASGKFGELLLATAKSPAMLIYLDNFSSAGTNNETDMSGNALMQNKINKKMPTGNSASAEMINNFQKVKKAKGINENYARELMELHTLGVDGGYTQQDVTQAARVLTGWTVYPLGDYRSGNATKKVIDRIGEDKLQQRGFVHEDDFLFAANRHDRGEKKVLKKTFNADKGYEEGIELLKMLAHHPSTAAFISRKIAVRFVSDNPPKNLLDKMTKTFTDTDGDIKEVLITMVSTPGFWNKEAVREKTKSPLEFAISAVRSLNADVKMPYQLFQWIDKMGQKMYFYQAPTGFPDRGQYWINTGSLLNRMNFGLALASQRIPGIRIDLLALNKGHEPESAEAALLTYGKIVMPERDLNQTVARLTPLLHNPELEKKVEVAAGEATVPQQQMKMEANEDAMLQEAEPANDLKNKPGKKGAGPTSLAKMTTATGSNNMMSQVVGIIIGSPEFQRR